MIGLGNNIKKMREKIGMTQAELGEKIGVSGVAIMRYEKDLREPNINTLQKIASALDVPVTQLLPLDETEKEKPPTPSNDGAEGDKVSEDAVEQALIQAGFIKPGQDLSDEDLKFLLSVGETIKAWFGKGNK